MFPIGYISQTHWSKIVIIYFSFLYNTLNNYGLYPLQVFLMQKYQHRYKTDTIQIQNWQAVIHLHHLLFNHPIITKLTCEILHIFSLSSDPVKATQQFKRKLQEHSKVPSLLFTSEVELCPEALLKYNKRWKMRKREKNLIIMLAVRMCFCSSFFPTSLDLDFISQMP